MFWLVRPIAGVFGGGYVPYVVFVDCLDLWLGLDLLFCGVFDDCLLYIGGLLCGGFTAWCLIF